jgi:hypothetical protein
MTMNIGLNNLPEEVTEDVYLHVHNEYNFTSINVYPDMADYTCIAGPVTVTFEVKDKSEVINTAVESMRNEIQKVRAEAEVKCNAIEEKIQSMLALPNLEKDGES